MSFFNATFPAAKKPAIMPDPVLYMSQISSVSSIVRWPARIVNRW